MYQSSQLNANQANPSRAVLRGALYHAETFRPSNQLSNADRDVTEETRQLATQLGVPIDLDNLPYKGDIGPKYLENRACPPEESCNVRITNIHPEATDKEILEGIWEGGIQKYHKLPANGQHNTCAANIAFKITEHARGFLNRAHDEGIYIRGLRIKVKPNRDTCRAMLPAMLYQSRVLKVFGPSHLLSADSLLDKLHQYMVFDLVEHREWRHREGVTCIELTFGSIEGQSRQAKRLIQIEGMKRGPYSQFWTRYEFDPCDPASGNRWNGHRYPGRLAL